MATKRARVRTQTTDDPLKVEKRLAGSPWADDAKRLAIFFSVITEEEKLAEAAMRIGSATVGGISINEVACWLQEQGPYVEPKQEAKKKDQIKQAQTKDQPAAKSKE